MDNHNSPHEILDSLKEYFVDELKEILLAYEREDREKVHSLVSEIDRYSYADLMLKKSSEKERVPLFEEDEMWEKYKKRFSSEGYKENSVDILTVIFYWGLDKELRKTIDEDVTELKLSEVDPKENTFFEKIGTNVKIFGNISGSVFFMLVQIFNVLVGIVPTIWLLIEGGWPIIIIGVVFGFVSAFLVFIVNIPNLFLSAPFLLLFIKFGEKRKFLISTFFYFLSTLYSSIVISIWSIVIIGTALEFADEYSVLPLLLWSYVVALGPWMYSIRGDTSSSATSIVVYAMFSYLISIIIILLGLPLFLVSWTFIIIMILGQIVLSIVLYRYMKKDTLYNRISHML